MKEEENMASYLLRIDEIINAIRGLGVVVVEESIVQKILRTFPSRFDSKVSVLEDRTNLNELTRYELHKILTTYEMRNKQALEKF